MEAKNLVSQLTSLLAESGLDVATPLQLSWYNNAVPPDVAGARIRPSGRAGSTALVVLIGNSKLAWEPFLEACSRAPSLLASEHPFNEFVETGVGASLRGASAGRAAPRVYWSHKRVDDLEGGADCQYVAMQRMASAAGLAYLDHDSHLSLHPKFGPWFSLRAAVVFDNLAWDEPQPRPLPNPMCPTTRHYVRLAMDTAIHCAERRVQRAEEEVRRRSCERRGSTDSCGAAVVGRVMGSCSAAPAPASPRPTAATRLTAADERGGGRQGCNSGRGGSSLWAVTEGAGLLPCSADSQPGGQGKKEGFGFAVHDAEVGPAPRGPSMSAVRSTWRKWVAVRDAPCPGHPWRYSEEQLTYHYTADKGMLHQALARRQLAPAALDVLDADPRSPPAHSAVAKLVISN